MGAELYVHSKICSTPVIARVSGQSNIRMDDRVTLQFHCNKMHLFDKKTEETI
jgi:multiple sugar transport system ATP-binding protein